LMPSDWTPLIRTEAFDESVCPDLDEVLAALTPAWRPEVLLRLKPASTAPKMVETSPRKMNELVEAET